MPAKCPEDGTESVSRSCGSVCTSLRTVVPTCSLTCDLTRTVAPNRSLRFVPLPFLAIESLDQPEEVALKVLRVILLKALEGQVFLFKAAGRDAVLLFDDAGV